MRPMTSWMVAGPARIFIGREASGKTLGLIGFGAVGKEVAARGAALGMLAVAHDPYVPANDPSWTRLSVTSVTLDRLLASSDVVSLHVPLTPETRHLINERTLSAMKPGAVLINAARGGVVDEGALRLRLEAGFLAGAMLDVFEREPPGPEAGWRALSNLILTPHIAGVSREANARVSAMIAAAVREILDAPNEHRDRAR